MLTATLERTGEPLASRLTVARGFAAMRGLIGRDRMEPGEGIYFPEATLGAIHSFWMRFRFDAVYLTRQGVVRHVVRSMPPWRFGPWDGRTGIVLELPEGAAVNVRVGDTVRLDSVSDRPHNSPSPPLGGGPPVPAGP